MRKLTKLCVSVVLVLSMFLSLGANAFAANIEENPSVISSHVEFVLNEEGTKISAQAFVRNYTDTKRATLIIASYDGGNLVASSKVSGINKVLKTEEIAVGTDVMAFVWEDGTYKPLTKIAHYSKAFNDVCEGLEITLDGEPLALSNFTATDSDTYEYTKDYGNASEVTLPVVKAKINDNGATVSVTNDSDAKKSIIKVSYGATCVSKANIPGYDVQRSYYNSAYEREYIINYKTFVFEKDPTKIYEDEIQFGFGSITSKNGAPANINGGVERFNRKYSKHYDVSEDGYQKVNLEINGDTFQSYVVVVKPDDSSKKGQVIGEAQTDFWTPTGVLPITNKADANNLDGNAFRIGYDEQTKQNIYGKKSAGNPAYCETGDGSRFFVSVFYDFQGNDGYYRSGSNVVYDRSTLKEGKQFVYVPEEARGCETVLGASLTTNATKFEFYILESAEVIVYSSLDNTVKAEGETLTKQIITDCPLANRIMCIMKGHQKTDNYYHYVDILTAYLNYKGAVSGRDYLWYDWGGLYIWSPWIAGGIDENGYIRQYDIYDMHLVDANGNVVDPTTDARLKDLVGANKWAVSDINAISALFLPSSKSAVVTPFAQKTLVTDIKAKDKTYHQDWLTLDARKFDVDEISGTGAGSYRVFRDRTNQVGAVVSYPQVLELYGNTNVRHEIALTNNGDSESYVNAWKNMSVPFHSFKVTEDSEILIFTYSGKADDFVTYKEMLEGEGACDDAKTAGANWIDLDYAPAGHILIWEGYDAPFWGLSGRTAQAGEEITIYSTNGNSGHYLIFVRPIG